MPFESILVTSIAPMEMHRANSGQNELGNASAIKRRPDGRVYISGQMQRHALFEAISRLNEDHPDRGNTYVSNGDATTFMVEKDLRADLGGFMITDIEGEPGRRTAPVSATPAVAMEESDTVRDLLLRLRTDGSSENNIATMELSQDDRMRSAFHLDCTTLSTSKRYTYEATEDGGRGLHVDTEYVRHADPDERMRRVRLFLDATRYLNAYASQARNAVTGEPQKVFIVLDTRLSRKAARYFAMNETEQGRLKEELDERGAEFFEGDDTDPDANSVQDAYENAVAALDAEGITDRGEKTMDYADTFEALEELKDFADE